MKFEIKTKRTKRVIFTANIEANQYMPYGVKLGMAVKQAVSEGVSLAGTNLRDAHCTNENLTEGNFKLADLSRSNFTNTNFTDADCKYTDFTYAKLEYTNFSGVDFTGADFIGVNITGTNLEPIKKDMFDVLSQAIPEIPMVKEAIIEGKIDGTVYSGECACLCGTIEKSGRFDDICNMRDSDRPIERFFLSIRAGDTPKTNQFSKLALEWIEEFEEINKKKNYMNSSKNIFNY